MDFIRVTAKTVEEAITEATIQLETSSDNIEYHVIEKGSSGFFGIGSKPAVIEARKREESSVDLEFEEIKNESTKAGETKAKESNQREERKKPAKPLKPAKQNFKESTALPKAPSAVSSDQPVKQQPVKEEAKEVIKKAPANKEEVIARVNVFLNDTFRAMGIEVDIRAEFEGDDTLNIELSGNEMGILIGKRGRTLDSMQYLTSLVANKGNHAYVRVKLDTEDYRRRRKETLENLAYNIAVKVRRTKKTVFLEPMNPYERRIIHSALQNNPYVSTHSEGEEPYRKVVVTLKK
ncbi:RNA-binding cell elongation regulator Jag/EloR [Lachnospiraceae bacterium 46-15]